MAEQLKDGCQILIVGGGITALTTARELISRGAEDLVILEKEATLAPHASSRNSGVLHAGIYYTPETLKARFCLEGNRRMKEYCRSKGLTLKELGKVIVAKNESEEKMLDELKRRADAAGAPTTMIDEKQLAEIEPYAKTSTRALYSPATAVIRPREILESLEKELVGSGKLKIAYSTPFSGVAGEKTVATPNGNIRYEKLINVAGSFADRVAQKFDLAHEYRSIPVKGTYRKVRPERAFLSRSSIYPVPDLRNPFLGVHFTRNAEDSVYVGPTAIPAFGRENYKLLEGLGPETLAIFYRDAVLVLTNPGFRSAALSEPKKYLKRFLFKEAKQLVPSLEMSDLISTDKVGIRPQLVHWPTKTLVTDFLVLKDGDCLHVLNAISPAFTSSMASAEHIVNQLLGEVSPASSMLGSEPRSSRSL